MFKPHVNVSLGCMCERGFCLSGVNSDLIGCCHRFADQELRRTAVHWMDSMPDSELLDFLPQLVQVSTVCCCDSSSMPVLHCSFTFRTL